MHTPAAADAGAGVLAVDPPHQASELRADAARNRAKVLLAAREMLGAGDPGLAMNVVARAAGVGVGTVYRHFPTREVLLEHLAADSFGALLGHARAAADEPDPGRGLAQVLAAAVDRLLADVALGAVLRLNQVTCDHTTAALGELIEVFAELLERARHVGAVRADISPDDLRRYLLGAETAARLTDSGDGPDRERVRRDLDVLLTGLRAERR